MKWTMIVPRIIVWGGLTQLVGLGVMSTKQTLSYSSVCTRCLATRSGVERSFLGIPYEEKFETIRSLYASAEEPRPAEFSESRVTIYEQIHGKACEHDFARTGFCRYRSGSVGCGQSGGSSDVWSRKEMISGTFAAFERISDKELAVRSCQMIEREFPLVRPQRSGGQDLVEEAAERAEHYRRMILLGELLGLVRNKEDWVSVLDYVAGGFQGDPPLISDLRALSERVETGGTVTDVTAAGLLAQRSATSDAIVARLITQGSSDVAGTVKSVVIWKKRLELFGLALEGYKLSEQQKIIIRGYPAEDFLRLLALGDKNVDEMCAENIWYANHFVLLDPMLAALNRNDSQQARETIEKLLRGGNPYSRGGIPATGSGGYDPEYMWNQIKTMNAPIETMRETITAGLGGLSSGYRMNFHEAIKGIGDTRDRKQWDFLKKAYLMCLEKHAHTWHLAVLGRAMHQLDAQATENFLIGELRAGRSVPGAISAMGFIGSHKFQAALEEFAARPMPVARLEDGHPKNYYDTDGDGTALIAYALHRCRGIPSWKLVKDTEGRYVIEKSPVIR
jgi:hypothetical protein